MGISGGRFLSICPEVGLLGHLAVLFPVFLRNLHTVLQKSMNVGDIRGVGSISGSGRSPGEGNGNRLLYSCLGNLMNRGAWQAVIRSQKGWARFRD